MSNLFNLRWFTFILAFINYNIIFWKIKLYNISFLRFLFLLKNHLTLLSHAVNLQKLPLELNFFFEFHLNDQALVIIDHQFVAHFFDLPCDLRVVELGVFQLPVTRSIVQLRFSYHITRILAPLIRFLLCRARFLMAQTGLLHLQLDIGWFHLLLLLGINRYIIAFGR